MLSLHVVVVVQQILVVFFFRLGAVCTLGKCVLVNAVRPSAVCRRPLIRPKRLQADGVDQSVERRQIKDPGVFRSLVQSSFALGGSASAVSTKFLFEEDWEETNRNDPPPSLSLIHHPLTGRGEGCSGTTDDFTASFLSVISVLHCPLGLGELQACPFPDVVFPLLFLSARPLPLLLCLAKWF